ncbi:RNB-domain-containing protein [Trametopsis cervina]|nr:RNB-domain-containing protein [Trametopsis cervina]
MHRRSLSCLIESSGSRTCLRRFQSDSRGPSATAATESQHESSPSSPGEWRRREKPQGFAPKRRGGVDVTADFTRRLVQTAVKNADRPEWKRASTSTRKKQTFTQPQASFIARKPTKEEQEFMKVDVAPDATADDDYLALELIQPGVLVELRRNGQDLHAVVVDLIVRGGVAMVNSMSLNGNIISHRRTDITFVVPGFVSADLMSRCGSTVEQLETIDRRQAEARVEVVRRISNFERQLDAASHDTALRTAQVVEKLKPSDPNAWSTISASQVAQHLSRNNTVSLVTLFSIHKYLMSKYKQYVAPGSSVIATQTFWVRPRNEVADLEHVDNMVIRHDPRVSNFVEKAKELISARRALDNVSSNLTIEPHPTVTFTEDEQAIIRFLKAFVRTRRSFQKDPYQPSAVAIMRQLGLYEDHAVTTGLVHRFLIEIGALSPWAEPRIFGAALEARPIVMPPPDSQISMPQRILPNHFYPEDPVANIRHDFGDLAVYVIDDATAQELDDGMSVEPDTVPGNYWVHVHIADPTSILHPLHSEAQRARQRMFSDYMILDSNPMLSPAVKPERLSLGAKVPAHKCLTFSFKVVENGDITDYAVRASTVRNMQVYTYDQVDAALGVPMTMTRYPFGPPPANATAPAFPPLEQRALDDLRILNELQKRLSSRTAERGTLQMMQSRSSLRLKSAIQPLTVSDLSRPYRYTGFPDLTYVVEQQKSMNARRIVGESMKAASRVASRFMRDHDIPGVRRALGGIMNAPYDTVQRLLSLRDEDGDLDFSEFVKAQVVWPQAHYTTDVKGHSQMGVPDGEGYVRVTSPLRRFGDMVHHWQIKQALLGHKKPCFSMQWMKGFATELGLKEKEHSQKQEKHLAFWALNFIERWHASGKLVDGQDILDNMESIAIGPTTFDQVNGSPHVRVFVHILGMKGLVIDLPTVVESGQTIKTRFHAARMGAEPMLLLKAI